MNNSKKSAISFYNADRVSQQGHVLLCPGPVNVSSKVKDATTDNFICHRDRAFEDMYDSVSDSLLAIVNASSTLYRAVIITGSGTAANEAVLSSVAPLGKILVVSNGEFGERLSGLLEMYEASKTWIRFPWCGKMDFAIIEKQLQETSYAAVVLVHHETSTGMLNDIRAISGLAKKYGAMCIADVVSSIGAEETDMDGWDIDCITASSGKALNALPGLGIVVAKKTFFERIVKLGQSKGQYLSLAKHYVSLRDYKQTPNTPAVNLIAGLSQSCSDIIARAERPEPVRARYVRSRLTQNNVSFLEYGPNDTSVALTCVVLPDFVSYQEVSDALQNDRIIVYNGKGPLKDKYLQIGHMGHFYEPDYRAAVDRVVETICGLRERFKTVTII